MRQYAESPRVRTRQLISDAALVAWVVLWIRVAAFVTSQVDRLSAAGRAMEGAGADFAETLEGLSRDVAGVPAVGSTLRGGFDAAAEAGRSLARAGVNQQSAVHSIALTLGILFAVIAVTYAVARYLPTRIAWIREASAARAIRLDAAGLQIFALRALATRPLHELRRAAPDPGAAYARGDYEPLARIELEALGLGAAAASPGRPRAG